MEEEWIEVYSETLQRESLVRITDEIEKNSEFVVDKSNVRDYFDCDSFLDVLEELNIEYNIEMKRPSVWNEKGQHSYGEATLYVYVKESDEEKLTYSEPGFFELPEELQGVNLDETEENDDDGEYGNFVNIFFNILLISVLVLIIALTIDTKDAETRKLGVFLGALLIIPLIKVNKKKKKKTRRIE